jgi:hypothetical protein
MIRQGVRLAGKAMVYTGYEMPTADSPEGRTIVFTKDSLLDYFPAAAYQRASHRGLIMEFTSSAGR